MKNSNILLKKRITLQVSSSFSDKLEYISGEYSKEIKPYEFGMNVRGPPLHYITWPFGGLTLFKDKLVLKHFWKKWELPLNEIDYIQKNYSRLIRWKIDSHWVILAGGIIINHKSKEIPKFVYVKGFGYSLFKLLKKISSENKLDLKFKE